MFRHLLICLAFLLLCTFKAHSQTAPCSPNLDFELGNLSNWSYFAGSCCPIVLSPTAVPIFDRHTLTSGSDTDFFGGFPVVAPNGGSYSFKLGNNIDGCQAEGARYYVHVPATGNYSLIFKYAVVLEDPSHSVNIQPRFEARAYDSASGNPLPCSQLNFVSSSSLPGFLTSALTRFPGGSPVHYKPWTMASLSLKAMNGKTVAIDFATGDCGACGHFGYAYVDIDCKLFQTSSVTCAGDNSTSLIAPPGFQSYQWWDSTFTTLYGSSQFLSLPTPKGKMGYAVILTPYPGYGCTDTLYTSTIVSDLAAQASNDTSFCDSAATQKIVHLNVNASSSAAPLTYIWLPNSGLTCLSCTNPIAIVSATSKYYVKVTDGNMCTITDTVNINIPHLSANIYSPRDSVCPGDTLELTNTTSNPDGTKYSWSAEDASVINQDSARKITLSWSNSGWKKVILTVSQFGCDAKDTIMVYVRPAPVAGFKMNKDVCINAPVDIFPIQTVGYYSWKIDEQTLTDTVYKNQYNFTWQYAGEKNVTLTVKGRNGCSSTYTSPVFIHENPAVSITVASPKICYGDRIVLQAPKYDESQYEWKPATYFENNNRSDVIMKWEHATTVKLNITNRWTCTAEDSLYINSKQCCRVFMPDAFTPNYNGLNDRYKPLGKEGHTILTFIILNRLGEIIYSTNNASDSWDGTYKGIPQDVDTYYYYLKYTCDDNKVYEEKGSFMLIR